MFWLIVGVIGVAVVVAAVILHHNVRVWRVRRDFQSVPAEAIEAVFAALDAAANHVESVTLLLPMHGRTCDVTASHVGGLPYAEGGDIWPTTEDGRSTFLIQVCLDHSAIGSEWENRLVEVFLVFDAEQTVRSYAPPSRQKYVAIDPQMELIECVPLRHLRIPKWRDTEEGTYWSRQLVESIPDIHTILHRFSNDVEGLLSQILCPRLYGYQIDTPDVAFIGDEPDLIQNPHEPACNVCGKPMRFLFQFGEVIPKLQLADAGVCYVYGCNDHPDCCKGFLDSH